MRLSLKQKQVLGVTLMVALIVIALSLLHLNTTAGVLLAESRDRFELFASSVYSQAAAAITTQETAYNDVRTSKYVQSALQSALYSQDTLDASIVDPTGVVIASSDPAQVGQTVPHRPQLNDLIAQNGIARLRAIYSSNSNIEWTQPMAVGDQPFGEFRIGLTMALVRRGDLGATLDLRDDAEFRELGDVFDQVSAQLRAASPDGIKPAQLAELSRRISMVGRLTAGVAHEMKNPLNAMTIHLELVKQKLAAGKSPAQHIEIIEQEIRRLDERIQGFLKFVRPDEAKFGPVAVAPLVSSVLDAVQPEAHRAGVSIERGCTDADLLVGTAEVL